MRKAVLYGLAVVCVCLVFALNGPSAQRTATGGVSGGTPATRTVGFVGVTTETFTTGVGALVASRACSTAHPLTRLCEWADVFRSIPPPALDTDVLVAQNYEVNPGTTCITPDGGLKCKPGALLPAACCGTLATNPLASITLSPSDPQYFASCTTSFVFTATALGATGAGIPGIPLFFEFSTSGSVTGTFSPSSGITDANGEVSTMLTLDTTCVVLCSGGRQCTGLIRARDQGGLILSNEVQLIGQVP